MRIIRLTEPYDQTQIPNSDVVLAMGFFDGVHRGHQRVINVARKKAHNTHLPLAVLTFDIYPKIFFTDVTKDTMRYLTLNQEKIERMEALGVDILYIVTFDENLAYMPPQEFIDKYVVALRARYLVAGADFTYGPPAIATMPLLPEYAQGRFNIMCVNHLCDGGQKVSSTRIRQALATGQMTEANRLLGYYYQVHGKVAHGFQRGRELGFPTLNVLPWAQERIPGDGVYAVRVCLDGESTWYQGMASIGNNETFGNDLARTVEINLFNFNRQVYGRQVTVEWMYYLRPMIKFDGIDELISQLQADRAQSRKLLASF